MIDSFLNFLRFEKRFSPHTIVSYQNDLGQFASFLKDHFEDQPESAGYNAIRSWIVLLVQKKSDPLSVNRKIASLRSFYKFLMRQGAIRKDPMAKIKVLKTKKKLRKNCLFLHSHRRFFIGFVSIIQRTSFWDLFCIICCQLKKL